ncbi:hypothetical protein BDZ97DRAFT_1766194 [Flammula alnicola]|nr:hypothetical protein BDZ97DRAFT_1766194 [Flammula alnicola]
MTVHPTILVSHRRRRCRLKPLLATSYLMLLPWVGHSRMFCMLAEAIICSSLQAFLGLGYLETLMPYFAFRESMDVDHGLKDFPNTIFRLPGIASLRERVFRVSCIFLEGFFNTIFGLPGITIYFDVRAPLRFGEQFSGLLCFPAFA